MNRRVRNPTLLKLMILSPTVAIVLVLLSTGYDKKMAQRPPETANEGHNHRVKRWSLRFDGQVEDDRIFFHETTGRNDVYNLRQLCAVESAAKENPDRPVQLFLQSDHLNDTSPLHSIMQHYGNVAVILIDPVDYFNNTPLEDWYFRGEWRKSPYATEHFSDYIRILSISKNGGMYMDLDFVTLKPFDRKIFWNFVPLEDEDLSVGLTGSALHFQRSHPVLKPMMTYLASSYRPKQWTHSGPAMIQKVVLKYCRKWTPKPTYPKSLCPGVKVLPTRYLYPLPFGRWKKYFQRNYDVDLSQSYAMHLYNKASKHRPVLVGSQQLYSLAASVHCPLSYAMADRSF